MAAPTARRRSKALLPTCYYEGYLEKRSPKETTSCRLWTCLCGNTLFFYNNTKDCEYTEKLELSGFISLADDNSRGSNLTGARFSLRMKDGEVKLTASSLEARVLWKGFILSVVELAVPSSLNLLPGQLHMLAEVIEKEKARRKPPPLPQGPVPSPYLPLLASMPPCYHPLSRLEAEMFLERNQEFGNFLLRPGRDGTSLAVTTYQDLNGRPVFRHYRVARKPDGGFSLDVENPIPCATLHDVIDLLVERTSGALRPLILEESYDENITFVQSNAENGERNLQCASGRPSLPAPVPPPKPGHHPAGQSVRSTDREVNFEDNTYVNYSSGDEDEGSVARSPTPPPSTGKRALFPKLPSVPPYEGQICGTSGDAEDENFTTLPPQTVKKALLPKVPSSVSLSRYEEQSTSTSADSQVLGRPVPPPRTSAPTKAPTKVRRRSLPSDHFTAAITDELKEKLEMRRAKCDEQRDSANKDIPHWDL